MPHKINNIIQLLLHPKKIFTTLAVALYVVGVCQQVSAAPALDSIEIDKLRLIGTYTLPANLKVDNTVVGGISGLDYNRTEKNWVAISDDKAQYGPVRFYHINMQYSLERVQDVSVQSAVLFKDVAHHYYSDNRNIVPDAESIRIDPVDHTIWWVGEGYVGEEGSASKVVRHPTIYHSTLTGDYIHQLPPLVNIRADPHKSYGLRPNKGLEGLSFSVDGKTLWAAMEGPMYQDDTPATLLKGALTRLTHLTRQGQTLGQYIYMLGSIPLNLLQGGAKPEHGVSDILALGEGRLLVVERIFSAGIGAEIRIYEINIEGATDVQHLAALKGKSLTAVQKRLLFTLDNSVSPNVDNVEGVSWGPRFENGHLSLVLVSDNNFSAKQHMQFFVFEVTPPAKK